MNNNDELMDVSNTTTLKFIAGLHPATLATAILAACGINLPFAVSGEGFRNPPPGTLNLGRAGSRSAHVDDASAIASNPANLQDLKEPQFQLAPSVVYISADYVSATGLKAETKEPWKLLPNLFASTPLQEGRFAVGLGITTPYGLANKWETKGAFGPGGNLRYTSAHLADLKTININPTVAFDICDDISIGLGLDLYWSELTFKQFYPWALITSNPGEPDGVVKVKGDGIGVGGNMGVTWRFSDRQRLAFTLKSPVSVDYSGDYTLSNVPVGLGGGTSKSDFRSGIDFPLILSLGYGLQVTKDIRVGMDLEWIQFSRFDDLPLDIENPAPGLPTSVREDWDDTFTIGIGGDWKFSKGWIARASYQFYESPIPDRTFSPAIPDANQNVLTVGIGFTHKGHHLEAAYGLDFYEDRNIRNNQQAAFNGDYSFQVHLFSFTYGYTF